MTSEDVQSYRLPSLVTPERYQIRLEPDLDRAAFDGEEVIGIQVHTQTDTIVLNALELLVDEPALSSSGGESWSGTVTLDEQHERLLLRFPHALAPGNYQLQLRFHGSLNDKLAGFYRSTYRDADGRDHVLASTQFESTDARRAFPCWDEPAFKAVFAITLTMPEELAAISNSPVLREAPSSVPGKKEVVFADTIKMSTYLVAFIVGELEPGEPAGGDGVPIQVWCVRGKRKLTAYAGKIAAFALAFFADYYGIPYPGAKLDLIAIPDFAAGAMENFGAVTFRETALLVDEATASYADLERVAVVVAHELAHMWFGDLVTMGWWNGLWLNEAFATFMEMLAVDAWKPEWETWVNFGSQRAGALLIDGLRSTRPIEFPVGRPEEAQAMFDVLTYQKGAAVLRMLQQYLGEDVFRAGVGRYLREHAYANTNTSDLWDALERASGQPVRRTMDSWIFQSGYPMLSVTTPDGQAQATLAQRRFLYLRDGETAEAFWQVPVILRAITPRGDSEVRVLLSDQRTDVALPAATAWVVANAGGHGFYRVQYDPQLLRRIVPHIGTSLAAIERFNLVSDTWSATLAGYTSLVEYLELTALFREETDTSVWDMLVNSFASLRRTMGEDARPAIAALARDRLAPAHQRMGWERKEGDNDRMRELRGTLLSGLGVLGESGEIAVEAERRYGEYLRDRTSVDPNIVPALIGILAATGGPDRYEEFWKAFKAAPTPQEEQRYLFALAGFRQPELLERTLAHTLDGEVRTQDAPYLLRSVFANKAGSELAWAFTMRRWDEMVERFPENALPRMCEGVTSLTTPELEADVRAFFATHEVKQAGKQLDQHLERLHMNVLFRQREQENLCAYRAG